MLTSPLNCVAVTGPCVSDWEVSPALSLFLNCRPLPVGHNGGWGANHWSLSFLFPSHFCGSRLSPCVCSSCSTHSTSLLICLAEALRCHCPFASCYSLPAFYLI